jgi:hypothetical protein
MSRSSWQGRWFGVSHLPLYLTVPAGLPVRLNCNGWGWSLGSTGSSVLGVCVGWEGGFPLFPWELVPLRGRWTSSCWTPVPDFTLLPMCICFYSFTGFMDHHQPPSGLVWGFCVPIPPTSCMTLLPSWLCFGLEHCFLLHLFLSPSVSQGSVTISALLTPFLGLRI